MREFAPPLPVGWSALTLRYGGPGIADARLTFGFDDGTALVQHVAKAGRNSFFAMVRPPRPLVRVTVAVTGSAALGNPAVLEFRPVPAGERRIALLRRAAAVLRGDPRSFPWRLARFAVQMSRSGRTVIPASTAAATPEAAYALWRERFDERPEAEAEFHRGRLAGPAARPRFTVLAGPDLDAAALGALLASLDAQLRPDWELLAPAGLPAPDHPALRRYDPADPDGALAAARGAFILLPRPGTRLRPHALLVLALAIDRHPDAKLVYADEDRIGADGARSDPLFKPAWSPARLLSSNFVGDPCCIAAGSLRGVGLSAEDGAAEFGVAAWRHDLMLRLGEWFEPRDVVHVAQVLSHGTGPAAPPAAEARKEAIRRALRRRGADARVLSDPRSPDPRVAFAADDKPLVTLIVPTRDRADLLRMSVGSILAKTAYRRFEVVVVDNGSVEDETFKLFDGWAGDPRVRVLRDPGPFNYARLNNAAAHTARGTLLGLVNNDVEVTDAHWLEEMVGWAAQPGIGCVGAKLWYPDGRLQHGGVVVGVAGAAGHRHKRAGRDDRGGRDDLVTVNEVSAVTAACLVVRKSVYDAVGGLDEARFAVGYNDVDFCLKVATAGYRNLWTPFAEMVHHESVSRGRDLSPKTAERFNREVAALREQWGERLLDDPYSSPNLTVDAEDGSIRVQ
ncbi:glycosyltransferase family 2 protein [Lichenibacterium dinghuense]|uniref:glycosyltransferase family 2 protein n=1 Tax=Lichenibacterium dinghuense TaxID=2895977 RepID=UPI001F470D23|nr:glycosyltransferase family 2 protein [Lichenibacterium sp. 6Y81]